MSSLALHAKCVSCLIFSSLDDEDNDHTLITNTDSTEEIHFELLFGNNGTEPNTFPDCSRMNRTTNTTQFGNSSTEVTNGTDCQKTEENDRRENHENNDDRVSKRADEGGREEEQHQGNVKKDPYKDESHHEEHDHEDKEVGTNDEH